jgi:hypothetical protein
MISIKTRHAMMNLGVAVAPKVWKLSKISPALVKLFGHFNEISARYSASK